MAIRHIAAAAVAARFLVTPLAAQQASAVELGAQVIWPSFDRSLGFTDRVGYGGLLGLFLLKNFSFEADASYTTTHSSSPFRQISFLPFRMRLTYHLPLVGRSRLLLGGGYAHAVFGRGLSASEDGVSAMGGLRVPLAGGLALRADGVFDYYWSPINPGPTVNHNTYWGVRGGLSFVVGSYGPVDRDHDGVADRLDRCPNTARGEPVDEAGCPDSDHDGVRDNVDWCAGTAAGERVDGNGCPILDADHDGVPDNADRCPNTGPGQTVDALGCPVIVDHDGDGVLDQNDRCPDTAAGVRVDVDGCPIDSDGDGVIDSVDRCPDTAHGVPVDGQGCPMTDGDGDGVPDRIDKCPDTPAGSRVGSDGCMVVFVPGRKNVVLEGVTFVSNRAELTIDATRILDMVVQSLKANPEVTFEIQGHSSSDGPDAYNLRLSQRRAEAVRRYFVEKGIDPARMTAKGYGETRPIADNATAEGRAQNRRVELVRTDESGS